MVTVLIVDDDPAICRLLKLALATEDIHVEGAVVASIEALTVGGRR